MKRIALISENLSPPLDEGFKKATSALAAAISRLGVEVVVFTAGASDLEAARGSLPRNRLLTGRAFAGELHQSEPDVILYIPQAAATPMSVLRSRLLRMQAGGVPVVIVSLQRRKYPAIIRPFFELMRPALVLVLSEQSLAIMRSAGFASRRIPLGVDTDCFRPASPQEKPSLRQKYGVPDGKVLLHVGHVSSRRNLQVLRRIAPEDTRKGARLVIVSSTSTTHDPGVRGLMEHPSVFWIDRFTPSIDEIYRLADGYVFPTFDPKGAIEIPLSVLEAMATNLPVVTTDFGGIPDLFKPGEGLYVCRTDADLIEASRMVLAEDVVAATRDKVAGLNWREVAVQVLEAIEQGLA